MSDDRQDSLLTLLTQAQVEAAKGLTTSGEMVPLTVAGLDAAGNLVSITAPSPPNPDPGAKMGLLLAAHEVDAWAATWSPTDLSAAADSNGLDDLAITTWRVGPGGVNEIEAWTAEGEPLGSLGSAADAPEALMRVSVEALSMSTAWARARSGQVPEIRVIRSALTAGLQGEGMHVTTHARTAETESPGGGS